MLLQLSYEYILFPMPKDYETKFKKQHVSFTCRQSQHDEVNKEKG